MKLSDYISLEDQEDIRAGRTRKEVNYLTYSKL